MIKKILTAALLCGSFSPTFAADFYPPLDPNQLNLYCQNLVGSIGTVTAPFSFQDHENITRSKTFKAAPDGVCVTDQVRTHFRVNKLKDTSPAFSIDLYFTQTASGTLALNPAPNSNNCRGSLPEYIISFWRSQGLVMDQALENRIRTNAIEKICPAAVSSIAKAIITKINGK